MNKMSSKSTSKPITGMVWHRVDHDFPIVSHFNEFMRSNVFFAEIWRHIRTIPTDSAPIAGVSFSHHDKCYELGWNPVALSKMSRAEIQGILMHEVLHVVFKHIVANKPITMLENVAMDLAVNSVIFGANKTNNVTLPPGTLTPGQRTKKYDAENDVYVDLEDTPENRKKYPLNFLVETLPLGLHSYEYNAILKKSGIFDKKIPKELEDFINSADFHDGWGSADDEEASEITQNIIKKALQEADSASGNGWGNIPVNIQREIRALINRSVNWEKYMEQFCGSIKSTRREKSIMRINKRYQYIYSGTTRKRQARALICVDASGSVSDDMLEKIYACMRNLNETVEFDEVQFDSGIDPNAVKTWRAGELPNIERTRCGGTNFNAPTEMVNDPRNSGRWDAVFICTDGEAPEPVPCKIPRVWLLPDECNLYFKTNELQIKVK